MIAQLIIAHLIGDFLLQNEWMQAKSKNSFVCSVHVALYSIPFVCLVGKGVLPVWAGFAIFAQHWLQDRFALHLRWMTIYGQSTPDKWPVGPLCVDQAWHLAFIGGVAAFC